MRGVILRREGKVKSQQSIKEIEMMRFLMVGCLMSAFISPSLAWEQKTHQVAEGRKISKPWNDVVGRMVVVEGLAWGSREKGLGQRVILDGSIVYVSNLDFAKQDLEGRLVRVRGTLQKKLMRAAPKGTQGYGEDFEYFTIAADQSERIDKATAPWMQEVLPLN
jgi:hypothetical protein